MPYQMTPSVRHRAIEVYYYYYYYYYYYNLKNLQNDTKNRKSVVKTDPI